MIFESHTARGVPSVTVCLCAAVFEPAHAGEDVDESTPLPSVGVKPFRMIPSGSIYLDLARVLTHSQSKPYFVFGCGGSSISTVTICFCSVCGFTSISPNFVDFVCTRSTFTCWCAIRSWTIGITSERVVVVPSFSGSRKIVWTVSPTLPVTPEPTRCLSGILSKPIHELHHDTVGTLFQKQSTRSRLKAYLSP